MTSSELGAPFVMRTATLEGGVALGVGGTGDGDGKTDCVGRGVTVSVVEGVAAGGVAVGTSVVVDGVAVGTSVVLVGVTVSSGVEVGGNAPLLYVYAQPPQLACAPRTGHLHRAATDRRPRAPGLRRQPARSRHGPGTFRSCRPGWW